MILHYNLKSLDPTVKVMFEWKLIQSKWYIDDIQFGDMLVSSTIENAWSMKKNEMSIIEVLEEGFYLN